MKYEIITKNYPVSKRLEEIIKKKFDKLSKFFDDDTPIKINLKKEKEDHVFEATIFADHVFRAEVRNKEDMFANVDLAVDKIVRQITKHKSRFDSKRIKEFIMTMNGLLPQEEEKPAKVVKTKKYHLKPMSVDEAKLQMELLGHDFFIFLNENDNNVNVVYRRRDGDVGIIEAII
ncbi:MAG TPA: ribosome-associated translation inhibitor RaiA [Clostridia bacterium]